MARTPGMKGQYFHPDSVRKFIQAQKLVERLQKCALGEIELTMAQIRAIQILLHKCVPDLISTEVKAEITHRYVAEIPPILGREEWLEKYGSNSSPMTKMADLPLLPNPLKNRH